MTTSSLMNSLAALGVAAVGVALCGAGLYVGETDDAPGAALIGFLLLIGAVALAVKIVRRKPLSARPR